jgi:transcriptional regulator GlxA family with amidase domain
VEAAKGLIDAGGLALNVVAKETGFGDPERMRRAFLRTLGQPPQAVRRVAKQGVDMA